MGNLVLGGTFIAMPDGLIFFHRPNINWQDLDKSSLLSLSPTTFENETIQQNFIGGLIESLKDMKTDEKLIFLRYTWLQTNQKYLCEYFNHLKYFEYYKIDQLDHKTELYNFCEKYRN